MELCGDGFLLEENMATLLWLNTEKEQVIDLGDPFRLWQVWAELARVCEDVDERFPELYEVLGVAESQEDCDPAWLGKVKDQSADYLKDFGSKLSPSARETMELLRMGKPTE